MEKQKWGVTLKKSRELKKKGAGLLFQRIALYRDLYVDEDYAAWCDGEGTNVIDALDAELDDTAFDFSTLAAVHEYFGNEDDWLKRGVRSLVAEVLERDRKDRQPKKTVMSWKDRAIKAEKECERLLAKIDVLEGIIAEMKAEQRVMWTGARNAQVVGA